MTDSAYGSSGSSPPDDDLRRAAFKAFLPIWQEARERYMDGSEDRPPATFTPISLSGIDGALPQPLMLDRLDPQESTILWGPSSIGKGALACSWIVQLVAAGKRVLVLDYEDHGGEWRRRIEGLAGPAVLDDILWIAPLRDGHGPIWKAPAAIRDYALANGVDYLVIDSAAYACAGSDPSKAEVAIQYGAALQVIGIPSLTLAHVTKLHDPRYPFGSAFWLSSTRAGWSLMPKGEDVLLVCRKASNYRKPSAAAVTMTWYEDVLREVRERPAAVVLTDRIAEVLTDGPMTPAEITDALNEGLEAGERVTTATVRRALTRGVGSRFTVDDQHRWRLAGGGSDQ